MRELERRVLLSVLDRKWREHLYEMDYLREGIYLRAYSQRDPLVEYQREGFDMFAAMMDGIKEESVGFLFNLEVAGRGGRPRTVEADARSPSRGREVRRRRRRPTPPRRSARARTIRAKGLDAPEAAAEPVLLRAHRGRRGRGHAAPRSTNADDEFAGVGRNALCPCGSGKKYKQCHGAPGGPTGLTTRVNG